VCGQFANIAIIHFTGKLRMDAVNTAGSRNPAGTLAGTSQVKSRKSIYAHFMNALKESRSHEARRVIANYAHLLAQDDTSDGPQRGSP
jgi:hypothetical protein